VIRFLRRWLLGAEPEGPPVLADPLYRWEVRRYWTRRRYAWVAGALLAWWVLAAAWMLSNMEGLGHDLDEAMAASVGLAVLGRFPLELLAAIGGALAMVPERSSGELEQLVLTPLDPWRLCWARYVGRMGGIMLLWALAGVVLLVGWPVVLIALFAGSGSTPDIPALSWLLMALVLAALHLDWGLMLLIDGANGLRFSATARSTASAVARSLLRSFLTMPFMMAVAMLSGQVVGMTLGLVFGLKEPSWLWIAGPIVFRLGLGVLLLRDDLAYARHGTGRIFFEPEAAT
jgi:hypothetical protein